MSSTSSNGMNDSSHPPPVTSPVRPSGAAYYSSASKLPNLTLSAAPTALPPFTPFTLTPQSTAFLTSSSTAVPSASSSASRKRMSRDDDDDEDDEDERDRPLKKLEFEALTANAESKSDDEDTDGATDMMAAADNSFFDLINHFASMDIPKRVADADSSEQCPVCSKQFPVAAFAEHVYQCIHSLDDVEKREQERLDEQLARTIQARESGVEADIINAFDDEDDNNGMSDVHSRRRWRPQHGSHYSRPTVCPAGANCTRTNVAHFLNVYHPPVVCPICSGEYQVSTIDDHVQRCLKDPTAHTQTPCKYGTKCYRIHSAAHTAKYTHPNPAATLFSPNPITSAAFAPTVLSSRDEMSTDVPAFSRLRDSFRSPANDDEIRAPVRGDDSDDDFEHVDGPAPMIDPPQTRPSTAPLSTRTISKPQLTVEQASIIASAVVARSSGNSIRSADASDPSLMQLLDTFKTLGFTAENLSRMKEQQESNNAANGKHSPGSA